MANSPTKPVSGAWQKPSLRYLLNETDSFINVVELVTSRGIITERSGRRVLALARRLVEHPEIHALSITDNPGGNAMISADTLGTDLISRGQEVIIHLSCKDWNRNGLQGRAWQLASEGFDNILALSGDYPITGYQGQAGGVFDLDSIGLLKMLDDMNNGLDVGVGRKKQTMRPTSFLLGSVVNNHKRLESEVMPQYFKLAKKIETGSGFIINQIGYDSRKQDELLKYMQMHGLDVPVLANVYVLGPASARFFHGGNIPGIEVTDELLALSQKEAGSKDKGKSFFVEFAAKQCAIAKGLGYRGVYLGGHLKYGDYERIIEKTNSFGEGDWREFAKEIRFSQTGEFFYFEEDPESGLSSTEVNREYLESKRPEKLRRARRRISPAYRLNRHVHNNVFEKGSSGFGIAKKLYGKADSAGNGIKKFLHGVEQMIKVPAFDCRDCGDCSLPDIAYLCPESQCVKNQRNGPCGGTRQGKCEIGEKECIWSRAYTRLKAYGEEGEMLDRNVAIKNTALKGTSAWMNTFLERDHLAKAHPEENPG